jgi:FeS assembly SUF system regulator
MLRITKQADYGFVLLIRMAGAAPEAAMHNARDLAAETGLPLPMVSKTLKSLARAGLLASHRGMRGGYSLARPAEVISAEEIITALDGPIMVSECLGEETAAHACDYEVRCPVKRSWQRLNEAISEALAGITLAEMAHAGGCCGGNGTMAVREIGNGMIGEGKRMQNAKVKMKNAKPRVMNVEVSAK